MKIIKVDDYNRDSEPDILIAVNVNDYYIQKIVDMLNDQYGGYFKAVEDDYRLSRGMEDLA